MNIDELPAGREMDALVAPGVGFVHDGVAWWTHPDGGRTSVDGLPHFSTDWGAAGLIIEHHPHYILLVRSNDTGRWGKWDERATWRCRFYAPEQFEARADTGPLAICRAHLKALEAKP